MQSLVFHFAKQKGFNIMKTDKELLIEALENTREYVIKCFENKDDYYENEEDEIEEELDEDEEYDKDSFYENILDIEFRIDKQLEYNSVDICLTFGGPNIWLDTSCSMLKGYWGSTRESISIPCEISDEIDDYFEDYYMCIK